MIISGNRNGNVGGRIEINIAMPTARVVEGLLKCGRNSLTSLLEAGKHLVGVRVLVPHLLSNIFEEDENFLTSILRFEAAVKVP